MPAFRDTEHLYRVLGALFDRVQREPSIAARLVQSGIVVRFHFKDPQAVITVDLRREPLAYAMGSSDLTPDVEFTQSGDAAHAFWLGRLSVPTAIATRKVVARGSVPKALSLLPALKPVFALYPAVLREIGEASLLPKQPDRRAERPQGWLTRLRELRAPSGRVDLGAVGSHAIPLVDGEPAEQIELRPQQLPVDERALDVEMLRRMFLIRSFEQRLAREFAAGTLPAEALHLSVGQEACAVGACFALRAGDYMTTTHRGHGHMIAMGADVEEMACEIFAKADGLCRGLGGAMHVTDARIGALGANGIVGASSLIATGAAMSSSLRADDRVALAFMGDGATAQGMFHEAVNFAAVFRLPVVFFVENNQYAEFTPLSGHSPVEHIAQRASGYGIPGITIDGNDVRAVYVAVRGAAERARGGEGPTLIEAVTYRWTGHSEGESAVYRSDEEIASWKARDPIARRREDLVASGAISAGEAAGFEWEAETTVDKALARALSSREPDAAMLPGLVFAPEPRALYAEAALPAPRREVTVSEALREALREELARDERVYVIGEDVRAGAYFGVTTGLVEEFGERRIIDTPISEYAIVGSCVGAAMTGMRPIAEIQFSDFITTCMDPLVNQAAKLRFMSGGQYRVPMVVRAPGGGGIGMAAQHSQSLEAWLLSIPGLIVIAPGSAADAKGLLKSAIRSNNPVVFFENKLLYVATGAIPEGEYLVPIGRADVKRAGRDVTLVAVGAMVGPALEGAGTLAAEGIDTEVVDPRTLSPCDWRTIVASAAKTGRVAVVEAGTLTGGFGSECAARIAESAWGALRRPVRRIAAHDLPIPYNRSLEAGVVPDAERIATEIRALMA